MTLTNAQRRALQKLPPYRWVSKAQAGETQRTLDALVKEGLAEKRVAPDGTGWQWKVNSGDA